MTNTGPDDDFEPQGESQSEDDSWVDLTRRQLLGGLGAIGAGGALTGASTLALLDDTERSAGNELVAGNLDLAVNWQEWYNGEPVDAYPDDDGDDRKATVHTRDEIARANYGSDFEDLGGDRREAVESTFRDQFTDLGDGGRPPLVDLSDVKPGDSGRIRFGLHLFDNPGFLSMTGALLEDAENGILEPEAEAGDDTPDEGELADNIRARVRYEGAEYDDVEYEGTLRDVVRNFGDELPLDGDRDAVSRQCFENSQTEHVVFEWKLPEHVGNEVQGDSVAFDLGFYAEQCRHQDAKVREFTIHAVSADIVYNEYGLHQPEDVGAMYVLEENLDAVREASGVTPGEDADVDTSVIQPLTIRANVNDVVDIKFVNHLDRPASIHQTALPYDVQESDGMHAGYNDDTIAAPDDSIKYRWLATNEGTHFFADGANQAYDSADEPPERANLASRGLFGALVVEPRGATWTDPETGDHLRSGVRADVHVPEGVDHREFLTFYHTPEGIQTADGGELTFPDSDREQTVHAINYRADPTGNRGKEEFYSSWVHGDPGGGDNVYEAYLGDPTKFVAVGASIEENHVHHLHGHRWKETSPRTDSDTIDSQTVGMGATYENKFVTAHGDIAAGFDDFRTVRPEMAFGEGFAVGAGGAHGSAGDYLFHCHLFPHYGEGMWGIFRVNDKEQPDLKTLRNNDPPIPADSDTPGFPDFIPGEDGEAPPAPPYDGTREPTDAEREALRDGVPPGAPYTDPADPDVEYGDDGDFDPEEGEIREYTIVALDADVVYNDDGHHDPEGIVYVLEEDAEKVRNGDLNPEPLFVRANVGDLVKVTLKNETAGGKSNHIHFVSYDVLGSDSLSNGYNYTQQADPGEALESQWYADEEGMIFFHDHITGIDDVMNGSFCGLIVEPPNSTWRDPFSGEEIRSGAQAIVENPDGEDFREFALHYQDFAQLRERNGDFVNPDVQHNENAGTMAINYRNAPYYNRDDFDGAYVHSSAAHGDPPTPLLEAYEDDPVRIRLAQGAYEEFHNFQIHGGEFSLDAEGLAPEDTTSQIIGVSEAFSFSLIAGDGFDHLDNTAGLPIRDHLYGSSIATDLWDGMWGIFRVLGGEVSHLEPLPDRGAPEDTIADDDLEAMGHPAPHADFDWAEYGQEARLRYGPDDDPAFPPDRDDRQNGDVADAPPAQAPSPGDPCPDDADVRTYDVTAFQHDIEYNDYGDHDPHGIVFALDEHVEEIRDGTRQPEPLTIRANRGECVEINLTNELPEELDDDHPHPKMRTSQPWDVSSRISLHPQRVTYDVNGSDGTAAGFNWDQTVAPGDTVTYRWYAEELVDTCVLWDHADVRGHRHHGAFGRFVVEPAESVWLDSATAEPLVPFTDVPGVAPNPTPTAMLKDGTGDGDDFREFALAFADGQYIINGDDDFDNCVVPPGDGADPDDPCNQLGDPEEQGFFSVNYRSEPFVRRFEENDDPSRVYDSDLHGDPATTLPAALTGDPVAFRVHMTADSSRGLAFHLSGHQWNRKRDILASEKIGVDDQFVPGRAVRMEPFGGAGGLAESAGDFVYQETKQRRRLEGGLWGLFRVRERLDDFDAPVQPLPDRSEGVDIRDRPGWVVATGNVTASAGTDVLVGVPDSDLGGPNAGAAYLFAAPVDEDDITDLSGADLQILGTRPGARVGTAVAFADGDVRQQGDGADFVVRSEDDTYEFADAGEMSGTVVVDE
ncbi:multicopper oxidase domain-containing protein [Halobacterium litoreum]|uniref:Multicopper oxidase domain-containing protein n=1 Tax=Halobacterium litoreum TaxID=2039234 RepID=A0ABD5NCL8_9EURY|nr:multicopper oxidase domain-containing protein [Halobacterium litoreum]UHH14126.1 multicopper oxidase domain-containing protein [Halobacterium litoreum]